MKEIGTIDRELREGDRDPQAVGDREIERDQDALDGHRAGEAGGQGRRRFLEPRQRRRQPLEPLVDPFRVETRSG